MKALKPLFIIAFLHAGTAWATGYKPGHKPEKESLLKQLPEGPNVVKLLIFNTKNITPKRDTSLTNHIKPDFESIKIPENKLWLRKRD